MTEFEIVILILSSVFNSHFCIEYLRSHSNGMFISYLYIGPSLRRLTFIFLCLKLILCSSINDSIFILDSNMTLNVLLLSKVFSINGFSSFRSLIASASPMSLKNSITLSPLLIMFIPEIFISSFLLSFETKQSSLYVVCVVINSLFFKFRMFLPFLVSINASFLISPFSYMVRIKYLPFRAFKSSYGIISL